MHNQQFNGISSSAVNPQINSQNIIQQLLLTLAANAQKEQFAKLFSNNEQIQQLMSTYNEMNKDNQSKTAPEAQETVKNPLDLFNQDNPGFFEKSGREAVLNYIKNFNMDKDEISKIAGLVEIIENSAIDGYLKKSAHDKTLNDENYAAKSKLTSYAQNATLDSNNNKVFTREEIGKMSGDEFVKNEKLIMEQVRQGLIK